MVALVKGHFFYLLQMFPNFCIQIYSLGFEVRFSTFIPNLVHPYTLIVCYSHVTGDG